MSDLPRSLCRQAYHIPPRVSMTQERSGTHNSRRPGLDQAPPHEFRQTRGVLDDRHTPTGSLVMSSDGQNTSVPPQQKCGRAEYATPSAFVPIRHYVGVVGLVRHDDTEFACQLLECDWVRDVPPLLEEGFAEREAHPFANLEVGPVGPVGQGQSLQRRAREPVDIEVCEQIRGHVLSQVFGVLPGDRRVERSKVHQLERPRPQPDGHVSATGPGALLLDCPQADVGEGTLDAGEDLDHWRRRCAHSAASRIGEGPRGRGSGPVVPRGHHQLARTTLPLSGCPNRTLNRQMSNAPAVNGTRPTMATVQHPLLSNPPTTMRATPTMTRTARPVVDAMNLENPMVLAPSFASASFVLGFAAHASLVNS